MSETSMVRNSLSIINEKHKKPIGQDGEIIA